MDKASQKVDVYPNPSKEGLFWTNLLRSYEFVVFNGAGVMIKQGRGNVRLPIDLSSIAMGVYTLKVISSHAVSYHAVIKK